MNIKRYIAGSMQEALQMVKEDMGPEAVILETKTLHGSGTGSSKSAKKIEVTAARDYEPAPEVSSGAAAAGQLQEIMERYRFLEAELQEIKEIILSAEAGNLLRPEVRYNRPLKIRYQNLRRFGLRPEMINRFMEEKASGVEEAKISATDILHDSLCQVLGRISVGGGDEDGRKRKIAAFIGPTGVGKTTTLAKLAALSAIKQGRKAALITTDTFRVAAASQLETYARIMGIPIETTSGRAELQKAVRKHHDSDFIFIDTAGSSPTRKDSIMELKGILQIPERIHSYLVLSATTKYQDLLYIERQFGTLPFASYIFTKLDETEDPTSMINFLVSKERPVSYFCSGQQVPDDIEVASRKRVASLLLARMRKGTEKTNKEVSIHGTGEPTEGRSSRPSERQCRSGASE